MNFNDVDFWILNINTCSKIYYNRNSPEILYNGCFKTFNLIAYITGLIVGTQMPIKLINRCMSH